MPRAAVTFHVKVALPGHKVQPGGGVITYEQMMGTIDRAYEDGERAGWQRAVRAVRNAAESDPYNSQIARSLLHDLIGEAASSAPSFFDDRTPEERESGPSSDEANREAASS